MYIVTTVAILYVNIMVSVMGPGFGLWRSRHTWSPTAIEGIYLVKQAVMVPHLYPVELLYALTRSWFVRFILIDESIM